MLFLLEMSSYPGTVYATLPQINGQIELKGMPYDLEFWLGC